MTGMRAAAGVSAGRLEGEAEAEGGKHIPEVTVPPTPPRSSFLKSHKGMQGS